jgi:hypothetical protein
MAQADEQTEVFVEANLLSIFYHELGHAIIDVAQLPDFGQEEDAADTASILLIDAIFDNETAIDIAYDAALGFALEAEAAEDVVTWSDVHGPDLQRFYNLVCLFYGADPDTRDDFAADMNLPEDRLASCPEEFDLANDSWGPVFDELAAQNGATSLRYTTPDDASVTARVVSAEVTALNGIFQLPTPITVAVEPCGEANAFYDPETRTITMCTEFETHLCEIALIAD